MNKNIKDELYNVFDNMISSNYNDVAKKIKNNKGVILNMEKKRKSKFFVTGGFGLAFAVILFFVGLIYFKNDNSILVKNLMGIFFFCKSDIINLSLRRRVRYTLVEEM